MPNAQEALQIVQEKAPPPNVQGNALLSNSNQQQMNNIRNLLENYKAEIDKALPDHMNSKKMGRIALTEIRINPKLLECSPESLFGAIIQCAQLGLEPGKILGHVFLVPYKGNIQVQIGYRGMIELGLRSGYLKKIYSSAVYEADEFTVVLGTSPTITHVPKLKPESQKGEITFF